MRCAPDTCPRAPTRAASKTERQRHRQRVRRRAGGGFAQRAGRGGGSAGIDQKERADRLGDPGAEHVPRIPPAAGGCGSNGGSTRDAGSRCGRSVHRRSAAGPGPVHRRRRSDFCGVRDAVRDVRRRRFPSGLGVDPAWPTGPFPGHLLGPRSVAVRCRRGRRFPHPAPTTHPRRAARKSETSVDALPAGREFGRTVPAGGEETKHVGWSRQNTAR